ncbi:MAG: hypothetical protein ACRDWX_06255 [Acidimicrobiia bacterium]
MARVVRLVTMLLAVALVPALPAAAQESIKQGEVVHVGLYSDSAADLEGMAGWAGERVSFAGIFHGMTATPVTPYGDDLVAKLDQAWRVRSTPFVNVMVNAPAAAVAEGQYDPAITNLAAHLRDWVAQGANRSVIIAPFPEMNTPGVAYGMDPESFKPAYRRFRRIFLEMGIDETWVRWAFAPNGASEPPYSIVDYYPGDQFVDLIGVSAFNFGSEVDRWRGVQEVVAPVLDELRALAPTKPYLLAQTGTSSLGGPKDAWLQELFSLAAADPNVVGLIYFNFHKETDWLVWDGTSGHPAWKQGLQRPTTVYQWPLTEWFQPGPLPFGAEQPPLCGPGETCDSVAFVDRGWRLHVLEGMAWGASETSFFFGEPGDVPLLGDWDCDGTATPAVYRPSSGALFLRHSSGPGDPDASFRYGLPSDIPLVGDWDGDGCDTLAVFRPSEARVYLSNTLGRPVAHLAFPLGEPGDHPFSGDFDGDGRDSVAVYCPAEGRVYLGGGPAGGHFLFGNPGDQILAGDWDGDGIDTVAAYRPSTGRLHGKLAHQDGPADFSVAVGRYRLVVRGTPYSVPLQPPSLEEMMRALPKPSAPVPGKGGSFELA